MKQQYTEDDIRPLLSRFMDGTTTLEEEDALSCYFRQSEVPAEWRDYQLLFNELEAMKPEPPARTVQRPAWRLWLRWAAAVTVVVVLAATLSQPAGEGAGQTAGQAAGTVADDHPVAFGSREDTADVLRPEPPNQEVPPDTTALRRLLEKQKRQRSTHRRRLRKQEPTLTDIDKAYALMARMEQEWQQVEQQMEQAGQEILYARLTATGYVAIQEEDGTIIYIDEPKEYFAYEE